MSIRIAINTFKDLDLKRSINDIKLKRSATPRVVSEIKHKIITPFIDSKQKR
jgi:hypothetical protein